MLGYIFIVLIIIALFILIIYANKLCKIYNKYVKTCKLNDCLNYRFIFPACQ